MHDIFSWLAPSLHLLPNYDEYGIAYKYRDAFFNPEHTAHLGVRGNTNFQHLIVFEGQIIGTWKRIVKKDSVSVEAKFFSKPTKEQYEAYKKAAMHYGKFLGQPITLL